MKQIIKISFTLTTICLVCAFLLALVYNGAQAKIKANQEKLIQDSIAQLAPDTTRQEELQLGREKLWKLYRGDEPFGYAVIAAGQGYGGTLEVMAVFDLNLKKIKGISVISDSETPGLGSRIREKSFQSQFQNLAINETKQIETITGATISSQAVVKIIKEKANELQKSLK